MAMVIGVDADGRVLLVNDGGDVSQVPAQLNGIALTAHELTLELEDTFKALPSPRGGVTFNGVAFSVIPVPAPTAEQVRLAVIDSAITGATYGGVQPATAAQLKAMTNQEITDWFNANFTNQAQLLAWARLITRIIVRRVL